MVSGGKNIEKDKGSFSKKTAENSLRTKGKKIVGQKGTFFFPPAESEVKQ